MSIYIDTSAVIAILDTSDPHNTAAVKVWRDLVINKIPIIISSYAVSETAAVLQNRLGIEALRAFNEDMLPLMTIRWLDMDLHSAAMNILLTYSSKNGLSLVDCTAFEIIRKNRVTDVFAYDRHFQNRGYNLVGE